MQLYPKYRANEFVNNYLLPSDTHFAYEVVNPLFDEHWCKQIIEKLANNKPIRTFYLTGNDIGNTNEPNLKYFVLFF